MRGTTTTIAEKMSISMPTPMRKTLSAMRNITCEVMKPSNASRMVIGTRAWMRNAVKPIAVARIAKIAPTNVIDSRMIRGKSRRTLTSL